MRVLSRTQPQSWEPHVVAHHRWHSYRVKSPFARPSGCPGIPAIRPSAVVWKPTSDVSRLPSSVNSSGCRWRTHVGAFHWRLQEIRAVPQFSRGQLLLLPYNHPKVTRCMPPDPTTQISWRLGCASVRTNDFVDDHNECPHRQLKLERIAIHRCGCRNRNYEA